MDGVGLEESIAFNRADGCHELAGFARIMDDSYPNWLLSSLLGIELESMGDGQSRWLIEARPEHANPMDTVHGGVLHDIGDAALNPASKSAWSREMALGVNTVGFR